MCFNSEVIPIFLCFVFNFDKLHNFNCYSSYLRFLLIVLTTFSSFFSRGILLVSKTSKHPVTIISTRKLISGKFSRHCRPLLASPQPRHFANPHRGYAMVVARILRGALKIRYLLLGGAVGGGVTLQKV